MLSDRMVATGHVLFRWRSYALLVFLPLFVWAVRDGESIEAHWGEAAGETVEVLAILMVILGEALRIATVGFVPRGTSGRNTAVGQVASVLNTGGLYSQTRNPLYLGNCLMYLGAALFTQHLWVVAVLCLSLILYYERIIAAEESFLVGKFGQPYRDWAAETPAFLPRLHGWRAPGMPFSPKTVIRREHSSIFGGLAILYLIELGLHNLPDGSDGIAPGWHWLMALAAVLELLAITAKKRGWLEVAGR